MKPNAPDTHHHFPPLNSVVILVRGPRGSRVWQVRASRLDSCQSGSEMRERMQVCVTRRRPSAAACRARRRQYSERTNIAARAHATCTGGSVPMATLVIDPPPPWVMRRAGGRERRGNINDAWGRGGAGRGTGEKTSERADRGSPLNVCREKDQRRSMLGSICEATPATLRAFADENIPFVWPLCCSSWAG